MDFMNYLSPFEALPFAITLHKINKNFFGKEIIELNKTNKLYDYLVSPLDTYFFRAETENYQNSNLNYGDIIIVEKTPLKIDGLALVKINGSLAIREIEHDKDANTILKNSCDEEFEYFGIITYVVKSDNEDFIEMLSEDLFRAS